MRKSWVQLLLALCLVLSQEGALLHALRHQVPSTVTHPSDDRDSHPAGVTCSECLAFAHLGGVVAGGVVAPALLALDEHVEGAEGFSPRAAEVPRTRARDPPRTS